MTILAVIIGALAGAAIAGLNHYLVLRLLKAAKAANADAFSANQTDDLALHHKIVQRYYLRYGIIFGSFIAIYLLKDLIPLPLMPFVMGYGGGLAVFTNILAISIKKA